MKQTLRENVVEGQTETAPGRKRFAAAEQTVIRAVDGGCFGTEN